MLNIFIGWDRRELAASQVCARSLVKHASMPLDVRPLILPHLQATGLYTRPTKSRNRFDLWDEISQHRMATDHAISRFLVPHLCGYSGWALSCDGDVMFRADVAELFGLGDPKFAVMVVKHDHRPKELSKMDGQVQSHYERKNWSSVILWNAAHPANKTLTLETVNTARGLWLHRRRIVNARGQRYSLDMIGVTSNAACSIALRNAIFRGVPKALWADIYQAARKTIAGDFKTLEARRAEALETMSKEFRVTHDQVFAVLEVKGIKDITIEHLVTLNGIVTAIRDGDSTVEQVFGVSGKPAVVSDLARETGSSGSAGAPPAQAADAVTAPKASSAGDETVEPAARVNNHPGAAPSTAAPPAAKPAAEKTGVQLGGLFDKD